MNKSNINAMVILNGKTVIMIIKNQNIKKYDTIVGEAEAKEKNIFPVLSRRVPELRDSEIYIRGNNRGYNSAPAYIKLETHKGAKSYYKKLIKTLRYLNTISCTGLKEKNTFSIEEIGE